MTLLEVAFIALASARISRMLLVEHGPMAVFHRLRTRVGAYADDIKPGTLAQLFNCPWCMTFWWSLILVAAVMYCPLPWMPICYVLAASFVGGWLVSLTTS